jgi:hypothetical protein
MTTWRTLMLGDVAEVTTGNPAPQAPGDFAADGEPFVRMQDVGREHRTKSLMCTTDQLAVGVPARFGLRRFPKGTLLIPKSGASVNLNHRALLGTDAYVVSHLAAVIPDTTVVEPEFLYYWSLTYDPRHQAQTTSLPSLPTSLIKAATVPLPSLAEQRRIVDLLSRAEGIVRLRRQAQQKAASIVPALYLDMFGDPATNSKHLPTEQLDSLCTLVRGSSPRPQGDPRFFGGPVPRLMIADITRDGAYVTPRIDSLTEEGASKSRPMKRGEVVMAVSGAVGLPAILAVDACIHDGFVGFRELSQEVMPEFFYNYLVALRHFSRTQAVGATFQNLKTEQIRVWQVPRPSAAAQRRFAELAESARAIEAQQTAAVVKADAMFHALLAQVFQPSSTRPIP